MRPLLLLVLLPVLACGGPIAVSGTALYDADFMEASFYLSLVGDGIYISVNAGGLPTNLDPPNGFALDWHHSWGQGTASVGDVGSSYFDVGFAGANGGRWDGHVDLWELDVSDYSGRLMASAGFYAWGGLDSFERRGGPGITAQYSFFETPEPAMTLMTGLALAIAAARCRPR